MLLSKKQNREFGMAEITKKNGFALPIFVAFIFTVACNYIIALTGIGIGVSIPNQVVPTGWGWVDKIVGFVWIALLCGLAVAWVLVRNSKSTQVDYVANMIIWLGALCLVYPFSFGLSQISGLFGNIIIGYFAAWVSWISYPLSRFGAFLIIPIIFWLVIATVYLALLILANIK